MENEAQLSWEARFGRLAAGAAFASVVFQIASFAVQVPAIKDAPGRNDPLRYERELAQYFHPHSGPLLASAVTQAIGTFLLAGALFYLFRATRHRREELPKLVQWLLVIAPVLMAVAAIAGWVGLKHASDDYRAGTSTARKALTKSERNDLADYCRKHSRGAAAVRACTTTRTTNEEVAKKLIQENQTPAIAGAGFASGLALAFAIVIIALNAMRAGLLSRFMGVLGIIVGALIVLPLLPQSVPIIQIFWLAGLGMLFLGIWPGGRGPAWETGEATPWPVPERPGRGRAPSAQSPEPEPSEQEPEGAPAKPHPVSKKRKRKRRR